MGHLLYGYKRMTPNAPIVHRTFDSDKFPDDWFDSPEKVIAAEKAEAERLAAQQAVPEPVAEQPQVKPSRLKRSREAA